MVVDGSDQLLVDLAVQYLAHDIHSCRRGHALAILKFDGNIVMAQRLVDGLAAAMHDDGAHADNLEQNDVAHHVAAQLLIDHGRSAILDNDRLAGQVFNPRQRFEQQLRGCFVGFERQSRANFIICLVFRIVITPCFTVRNAARCAACLESRNGSRR